MRESVFRSTHYSNEVYDTFVAREPANRAMHKELVESLQPVNGRQYLDIGGGTGAIGRRIREVAPDAQVTLLDMSPSMVDYSRKQGIYSNCLLGSMTNVPFPSKTFDGVVSSNSLYALCPKDGSTSELNRAITVIYNSLKPGGDFVVSSPNENWGALTTQMRYFAEHAYYSIKERGLRGGLRLLKTEIAALREPGSPLSNVLIANEQIRKDYSFPAYQVVRALCEDAGFIVEAKKDTVTSNYIMVAHKPD